MTRHPPQPLTPEERALAAQLPRLHGHGEPDPKLDARILAAARTAVAPRPALRPRLRWIAPMAVAASLSLAVGLAWRLRPPPAPDSGPPMADAAMTELPEARAPASPPHPEQERQANSPPAPGAESPPGQRPTVATPETSAVQAVAAPAPPVAAPAPPAPAPMATAEGAATADMVAAPTVTPGSSPATAKAARSTAGMRERQATSAGAMPPAQTNAAAQAADAAAEDPQAFIADDPGEDVPPATADSPEVRDAWLRRIGELLQQGRSEEARASLAEFHRRYPDAPLPPELRKLEP